ncbi:MAG: hypothetical protein A2046_12150 [Bacteroidetes bacterium GWA2_30_7]|nr:MAG: hypothetical protein A2046_12150 [Bacteroidetes bacterium GWA2_30_7]
MSFSLDSWYDSISKNDVLFTYKGSISSELIADTLEMIENKLQEIDNNSRQTKKLYNVLVESLQNLYHHSEQYQFNGNPDKYAIFSVLKYGENFKVITGNFIKKDKIHFIKDRIEQLNSLSHEEIKALYKMVLNNEEFSEKGGGGLGMIDIVKRTDSKLEYCFEQFSEEYYFFIFGFNV